jgi:HEAT repeat protein
MIDPAQGVPALEKVLLGSNEDMKREAATALGDLGAAAARSVPVLIGALVGTKRTEGIGISEGEGVIARRFAVVHALERLGDGAKAAIPALRGIASDTREPSAMRIAAASAAGHLDSGTPPPRRQAAGQCSPGRGGDPASPDGLGDSDRN